MAVHTAVLDAANKKALLSRCRHDLGEGVGFVTVKLTALASPPLLEAMTAVMQASGAGYMDRAVEPRGQLLPAEEELLDRALANLSSLCAEAASTGLPSRWREICHFAGIPSPSVLKRLLQAERGAAE